MFNARSLRNKINEFKAYIDQEEPDIIVISESWTKFSKVEGNNFSKRDSIYEHQVDGYEMLYYDRKLNKGGGVVIYAKCSLNPVEKDSIKEGN